jgi:hypothetical protein
MVNTAAEVFPIARVFPLFEPCSANLFMVQRHSEESADIEDILMSCLKETRMPKFKQFVKEDHPRNLKAY